MMRSQDLLNLLDIQPPPQEHHARTRLLVQRSLHQITEVQIAIEILSVFIVELIEVEVVEFSDGLSLGLATGLTGTPHVETINDLL